MTESQARAAQYRYCTLYRVGYWASLDAECKTTTPPQDLVMHQVHFHLINGFGDRCPMGFSIIQEMSDGHVFDEDGDAFPSLDAAVRKHAGEARSARCHARALGQSTDST